jgi:multidrug efflux pump subunit AcrA (membrane-fusion protein)
MCELANGFLKSHQLRHFSHRQSLWTQLEDFTRLIHASLDPRQAAYTIANEGRRLIECDRLSVAILKGKKCRIEAISGQDMFDKRSNVVRLLNRLATAVVATGDSIWYTGDTRDLAPQVEDAVQEYVDEAHSKTVAVLPLRRPPPPEEDDPNKREEPEGPIGALIIEQIEDSRVSGTVVQRAEVVCRHSSTALANALEHQNLFLMPVWRTLGKTRWIVSARTLPKTLAVLAAVVALVLVLFLWQANFTLESKGTLEPEVRQDVFASVDGIVQDLFCSHEELVEKGKTLVQLRNTDLEVALADIQGQRLSNGERLHAIQKMLTDNKRMTGDERSKLEGELAETRQKQETLDAQWALYNSKQQDLNIKSPLNGIIITWDVKNRLIKRPVQRGQVLLRVADPSKEWQLELKMPEQRMGYIVKEQQKLYDASRAALRPLIEEDVRAKMGPDANEEEVQKKVDAAMLQVLDENLHDRIVSEYHERLNANLQNIAKEANDAEVQAKIEEVLRENNYTEACKKLKAILPEVEAKNGEVAAKLQAIPLGAEPDDRLNVSYILATDPSTTHWGKVKEMHRSAEIRGDEGNTVLIKVAINKAELPDLRSGASVTAQVYCGKRSLGFVLLHDVIAFIQSRIVFRYF